MRAEGTFIAVEIDDAVASDATLATKLTEACPVDIFARGESGGVEIVQKNLDECVLCRLCLDAAGHTAGTAGSGAVKVIKLYDNNAVLA
jgi:NAD-dependent dihydropyrimidine dehydrogenase PreA subunit